MSHAPALLCRARDPKTGAFETETLDEHVALIKRQVDRGLEDPELRRLAKGIVEASGTGIGTIRAWGIDYPMPLCNAPAISDSQIDALHLTRIWNFVVRNYSYIEDPPSFDLFSSVRYVLDARGSAALLEREVDKERSEQAQIEIRQHIVRLRACKTLGAGDCFPLGTLLLRDDYALVPVEHVRAGDRIWGDREWSLVEAAVPKGARSTTAIRLNNGSTLRLTEDHKVYVVICPRHAQRVTSAPCTCAPELCQIERIRVADLTPGMRLVQPKTIAFGRNDEDLDRHYVEGLYIADGWSEDYRFAISGLDGHPKEAQKREVATICARLGIATRWTSKALVVNDPEWTTRLKLMGSRAPQKRALSLDLAAPQAEALLRGIMADSGANTHGSSRTFTTTSRELAVQTRVLHRMFGRSCGYAYLENHGGLGTHPIHRLTVRGPHATGKVEKALRVKEIFRNLPEEMTYDLQTSDHKVYLPEHDVTVSNCDDATILLATLAKGAGFRTARARVVSTGSDFWEHVYPMVGMPRTQSTKLVALDPTVSGALPGWEYPRSKTLTDFLL